MDKKLRDWELFLKEKEFLCNLIPGLKIKYLNKWIAKVWPHGALIWNNTIYLKHNLPVQTHQRLMAHDAVHVADKQRLGWLRYNIDYKFKKDKRLILEARGYAIGLYIFEKQTGEKDWALEEYSKMLSEKYKLNISKQYAKMKIMIEYSWLKCKELLEPANLIARWWDKRSTCQEDLKDTGG